METVDQLRIQAKQTGVLIDEPNSNYPIGYWARLRDSDGHATELFYGQEIGSAVEQQVN